MTRLQQAMEAVEERKRVSFGDDAQGVQVGSDFDERAILGGFDIDTTEIKEQSLLVASYFHGAASQVGLVSLFSACWIDGLLTGLIAASLPPPSGSGLDAPDPDGEDRIA